MSTLNTIREMMVDQFQLDPAKVTPEATLEDLSIDSLSAVEFMFLLEEKFNVTAPLERVEMRTVQDVGDEIDRLIAAQRGGEKAPQQAA